MDPYYEADLAAGRLAPDFAQELIEALWLKYSEWGVVCSARLCRGGFHIRPVHGAAGV